MALRPLSDGGPGFLDVLRTALDATSVAVRLTDPLGREVDGEVLLCDSVGYVESAQACGLHLLDKGERDPKITTSYGLGLLLTAAVEAGARTVVVGLGGSATNDGGAGMLAALGAVPVDDSGQAVAYGGAGLAFVAGVQGAARLRGAELIVATDVDNPLLGPAGASAVFGPQKGATPADVDLLDRALTRWAEILQTLPGCPPDVGDLPGAGAAGGLGAALFALGGRREPGIALVRRLVGLDAALDGAGLVITGEGSFDSQSLRGKVVSGVASAAAERGLPCLVLAGQVSVGAEEMAAAGITAAYSLAEHVESVAAALAEPAAGLESLAELLAQDWATGHRRVP